MKKNQDGLLDWMARALGCIYVSDLHRENMLPSIQTLIDQDEIPAYSLKEWEDTIHYITGEAVFFETKEQAVRFLKHYRAKQNKKL